MNILLLLLVTTKATLRIRSRGIPVIAAATVGIGVAIGKARKCSESDQPSIDNLVCMELRRWLASTFFHSPQDAQLEAVCVPKQALILKSEQERFDAHYHGPWYRSCLQSHAASLSCQLAPWLRLEHGTPARICRNNNIICCAYLSMIWPNWKT
ncbi:uncharacterized protein MYCFIDRAFT_179960 [Pseudocercospora fijiensis CIRAD86]|uniref:Secreted protein n=1 Tax=Pseudocercospora fijiensis (strain CIRAD86) TaxID=383855 RepID=M2ZZ20_PSEFD|nr:uncharacterized protein MYCFIDRAFT_179960 [Pseudocercospora fijiensis CIRAD86]EME77391.1 hypothetical protein MYCFIDRAFT_179960 [Pseudocercospora fijiensis CIRAD86]